MEVLVAAVEAGDAAEVRAILEQEPKLIDVRTGSGTSLLQRAAYRRAHEVVEALLSAGWETDVHEAATLGHTERVRDLVLRDPARLTLQSADGAMPLHLAAHFGHVDTVRALLELGAPLTGQAGGVFGNTALHAAAAGGRTAVVEVLLKAGAPPDHLDANGCTALHVAAAVGAVATLELLLTCGASRDARANDGRTPLDVARERGMANAIRILTAAP